MKNLIRNEESFKNSESPFTELFSLLKRIDSLPEGFTTLAYKTQEIKKMNQHADNAMSVLLQGLQDIGVIVSMSAQKNKDIAQDLKRIGFFISAISNLVEALHDLQIDTGYVLKQRNE